MTPCRKKRGVPLAKGDKEKRRLAYGLGVHSLVPTASPFGQGLAAKRAKKDSHRFVPPLPRGTKKRRLAYGLGVHSLIPTASPFGQGLAAKRAKKDSHRFVPLGKGDAAPFAAGGP